MPKDETSRSAYEEAEEKEKGALPKKMESKPVAKASRKKQKAMEKNFKGPNAIKSLQDIKDKVSEMEKQERDAMDKMEMPPRLRVHIAY